MSAGRRGAFHVMEATPPMWRTSLTRTWHGVRLAKEELQRGDMGKPQPWMHHFNARAGTAGRWRRARLQQPRATLLHRGDEGWPRLYVERV